MKKHLSDLKYIEDHLERLVIEVGTAETKEEVEDSSEMIQCLLDEGGEMINKIVGE